MSVDIGICSFQKDCTHLYICMLLFLVCFKKKKRERDFYCTRWTIFSRRMDIVDQCSIVLLISVFGCLTNAFILKCT